MLVCPIRGFRFLRSLEIVKYVQHMLTGGRQVHQSTKKIKMAGLFVLFTYDTELFVAVVRILGDQSPHVPQHL